MLMEFLITFFKKFFSFDDEVISTPESSSTPKERSYCDYDWSKVIDFETGGHSYYEKFLKKLTWPKGESGITMGIGADLGYMTLKEFEEFFSIYFTKEENEKIKSVIGLKGEKAKSNLYKVKGIELSWVNASEAFCKWTLPKFWKMANDLWVGLDKLKEPAQIALVSIVFNRGSSTKGSTRVEMEKIKTLVLNKDYKGIAKEIRSMKRLWENKGLDGLLKRREEEAQMVENCV